MQHCSPPHFCGDCLERSRFGSHDVRRAVQAQARRFSLRIFSSGLGFVLSVRVSFCSLRRFELARYAGLTGRHEPRGGTGKEPPQITYAAGPNNSATEHDSRVDSTPRVGDHSRCYSGKMLIGSHSLPR